jgi:hypothetical protein
MNVLNSVAINAQSNSGTVNSAAYQAYETVFASIQATFTDGAAAGALNLQASNDNGVTPTNWNTVGTVAVAAGATTMLAKVETCYRWLRVQFVSSGGAGTLTATLNTMSY